MLHVNANDNTEATQNINIDMESTNKLGVCRTHLPICDTNHYWDSIYVLFGYVSYKFYVNFFNIYAEVYIYLRCNYTQKEIQNSLCVCVCVWCVHCAQNQKIQRTSRGGVVVK